MKTPIKAGALALLGTLILSVASAAPALIEIQKGQAIPGGWQKLPANTLPLTADGPLLDTTAGDAGFYRLAISISDVAGGPIGILLPDAPAEAVALATEFLQSEPTPEWSGVTLGPMAYPIYNPTIGGGVNPAYLEFTVVSQPGPAGASADGFATSPPIGRPANLGYLIVSLTDEDEPILEFATEGRSKVEQLRERAGSSTVRAVRYCENFLAAENANGELVASLGITPVRPPPGLLAHLGTDFVGEVSNNIPVVTPVDPGLSSTPYESYAEFKADYVSGPVYPVLRRFRTAEAKFQWGLRQGIAPELIPVSLGAATPILADAHIVRAEVDDPLTATVTIAGPAGGSGLTVVGLTEGVTVLRVFGVDQSCQRYLLAVANTNNGLPNLRSPKGLSFSWGPWQTYYAGSQSDQKCYNQEYQLAGCCANGWSGCGPTAWAMFYGYWDAKGAPFLIGGPGATPSYNNADVRACIQYEFSHIGTFCLNNGQAATLPWTMPFGWQWAPARGESISLGWATGTPYVNPLPRLVALNSIINHHRPAIVGTGFYSHYPLAWGYAYRNYTATLTWWWFGWHSSSWVVASDQRWITNDGQGSCTPVWVSTSSCWFGTDGYCY